MLGKPGTAPGWLQHSESYGRAMVTELECKVWSSHNWPCASCGEAWDPSCPSYSFALDSFTAPTEVENESIVEPHRECSEKEDYKTIYRGLRRCLSAQREARQAKVYRGHSRIHRVKDRCEQGHGAGEGGVGAGTLKTAWGRECFSSLLVFFKLMILTCHLLVL